MLTIQIQELYRIAPTVNNLDATKMDIQLVTGDTCLASDVKTININSECNESRDILNVA